MSEESKRMHLLARYEWTLKNICTKHDVCRSVDHKQQKETLEPHEITDRPWSVGTDPFSFEGRDYLITADYFSNFWEIDYLPDTMSSTVIRKLKAHFARQAIPDVVISDNGPQYSSIELKKIQPKLGIHAHYFLTWLPAQ